MGVVKSSLLLFSQLSPRKLSRKLLSTIPKQAIKETRNSWLPWLQNRHLHQNSWLSHPTMGIQGASMFSWHCEQIKQGTHHSHLLHLAHELDEDSVENLANAGQVCVGPGRDGKRKCENYLQIIKNIWIFSSCQKKVIYFCFMNFVFNVTPVDQLPSDDLAVCPEDTVL